MNKEYLKLILDLFTNLTIDEESSTVEIFSDNTIDSMNKIRVKLTEDLAAGNFKNDK